MNKLKLFIGVGVCGMLFSGCWFFGFDDTETAQETKQQEQQVVAPKVEPCDKMPDDLTAKLDEFIKKYYNDDKLYFEAKKMKEDWEDYFTGKRYASDSFDNKRCEIIKEAWEYAKNYEYTSTTTTYSDLGLPNLKVNKKKCLELDLNGNARQTQLHSDCYFKFTDRYHRLYDQKIK